MNFTFTLISAPSLDHGTSSACALRRRRAGVILGAGLMLATFGPQALATTSAAAASAPAAQAPAQAVQAVSASTVAPLPAMSPARLAAHATPYRGRFASACQAIDPDLHYIDSVELSPSGTGHVVNVRYRKALFSAPNCSKGSQLVTLALPAATWTFDGRGTASGKEVDLITIIGKAGPITATIAQRKKVEETADRLTVYYGKGSQLPISKTMNGANSKAVRRLENGRLYHGNDAPLSANGYPAELDLANVYTRQ